MTHLKLLDCALLLGAKEEARSKSYVADLNFRKIALQSDEAIRETEPQNGHPKKKGYWNVQERHYELRQWQGDENVR